jgi:hypothetical protein
MAQTCRHCSRINPVEATYCYFDGSLLLDHTTNGGPLNAGAQAFPTQFVFPSGERCRNFDQLALACQQNWSVAVDLLKQGFFEGFLGGLGRADLALIARAAACFPDRDRGLDQLLSKIPSEALDPPKLRVTPTEVNLGLLNAGSDNRFELTLTNEGMRLLYGSVSSDSKWLALSDTGSDQKLFQCHDSLTISVSVVGQHLRAGARPLEGRLVIESSGGTVTVVVQAQVPVKPFREGVLAGALSPRQIAEKARAAPREAAALFEMGAVAGWYKENGWTYPIQGPTASGLGAVQQFFEALGLAKPPRLDISERTVSLRGRAGERLEHTLTLKSQERRPVYAHASSDQPWLSAGASQNGVAGVSIPLIVAAVPNCPGDTLQGLVSVTANGGQRFEVSVLLAVTGSKVPPPPQIVLPDDSYEPDLLPSLLPGPADPPIFGDNLYPDDVLNRPFQPDLVAQEGLPAATLTGPVPVFPSRNVPPPIPVPEPVGKPQLVPPPVMSPPPLVDQRGKQKVETKTKRTTVADLAGKKKKQLLIWIFSLSGALLVLLVVVVLILVSRWSTPGGNGEGGKKAAAASPPPVDIAVNPEPRLDFVFEKEAVLNLKRFGLKTRPGGRELISGEGASNSTLLRIDGEQSTLCFGDAKWVEDQNDLGDAPWGGKLIGKKSVWLTKSKIQVTQIVKLVPNEVAQQEGDVPKRALDSCRIRYLLENKDEVPHRVGLRLLVNVRAGEKRGLVFAVPGKGELVTSLKAQGDAVPDYLQALEKEDLRAPETILHLSPKLAGVEPPERVVLTQLVEDFLDKYDIEPLEVLSEPALVLYWKEVELNPKATREVGFVCGLGHIVADPGGLLAVTLGGPLRIDKVFTVTAYVKNPAGGQKAALHLPRGLQLFAGEKEMDVPAPAKDAELSVVHWQVKADWADRFPIEVRSGDATMKKEVFIDQPVQPVYLKTTTMALQIDSLGNHKYKVKVTVTHPEEGQELRLILPEGMERLGGDESKAVPAAAGGSNTSTVEWTVRGTPEERRPIQIESSTGVKLSKFVAP